VNDPTLWRIKVFPVFADGAGAPENPEQIGYVRVNVRRLTTDILPDEARALIEDLQSALRAIQTESTP